MHLDNAVYLTFLQIRQRYIVSKQERQTRIIILEVKAFSHPFGQLVDKAENTSVGTRMLLVHQICFKFQPDGFILSFSNLNGPFFPNLILQNNRQMPVRLIKPIIQNITYLIAIDRDKGFPRLNPSMPGRAVCLHRQNFYRHVLPPVQSKKIEKDFSFSILRKSKNQASFLMTSLPL